MHVLFLLSLSLPGSLVSGFTAPIVRSFPLLPVALVTRFSFLKSLPAPLDPAPGSWHYFVRFFHHWSFWGRPVVFPPPLRIFPERGLQPE